MRDHLDDMNKFIPLSVIPESILRWFDECEFAIVALSGGVDSSLVAYLAHRVLGCGSNFAVIADSPSLKREDLRLAKSFCLRYGIPLRVIGTREIDNPNYYKNAANRCYFCKHTLYHDLQVLVDEYPGSWVLNGTNADDLGDYRPGLIAAKEFKVRSPLAECGFNKHAVRNLAETLGLQCWDKAASPCLSSRIAYGQPVTRQKLNQIEKAEEILGRMGFPVARFRHYGNEGRIEVPADEIPRLMDSYDEMEPLLKKLGFDSVCIDHEGFISGKLNREIGISTNKPRNERY